MRLCPVCGDTVTRRRNECCTTSCARKLLAARRRAADIPPAPLMGCRWIPLMHGRFTLVDEVDVKIIDGVPWHVGGSGYATALVDGQLVLMHWLIVGKNFDHISRDRLDNRRSNLRPTTTAQNNRNKQRMSNNTLGFVGLTYYKGRRRPWNARVTVNGKSKSAGYYTTREEAAQARDALAKQLHGEFARLTFPNDKPTK